MYFTKLTYMSGQTLSAETNITIEMRKKELLLDVEKESDSIMQLNNSIVHIDNDKVRFDCPLVDSLLVQLNLLVLI